MLIRRVKYCAILKMPVFNWVFGNLINSTQNLISDTEKSITIERNPGFDKKQSLFFKT